MVFVPHNVRRPSSFPAEMRVERDPQTSLIQAPTVQKPTPRVDSASVPIPAASIQLTWPLGQSARKVTTKTKSATTKSSLTAQL